MKETVAKTVFKHGENLRNATVKEQTSLTWSVIQRELVKYGINSEILELMKVWDDMLENTKQKLKK